MTELRKLRKANRVSIDQLAAALGAGFSHGRLSMVERGLVSFTPTEVQVVRTAIVRIGRVRTLAREVALGAAALDVASLCADLRDAARQDGGVSCR